MRILFVIPPYRTTDPLVAQLYPMPLAAVSMGAVLEKAGHHVAIKDFLLPVQKHKCHRPEVFKGKNAPPYMHYGQRLDDAVRWLSWHACEYDAIGLCMGQCNVNETGIVLARAIKATGVPLVIGGPWVTTATLEAAEATDCDVAFVGEGEGSCEHAFQMAVDGKMGIVRGKSMAADELPLPAWHLAPPKNYPKYKGRVRGVLTISRGCPHACRFCSVHTIMGRRHSRCRALQIEEQILHLWGHGVRYFCFLDDNLFINRTKAGELLALIHGLRHKIKGFKKAKFYVEEGIEVSVAAIPGLMKRIAQAGFENLGLGIETLNDHARKENRKPYDDAQLAQAIAECEAAGITARAFYILGFLSDSVDSIARNLVEFGKLGLAVRANNLKLYPGTETTALFKERGLIGDDYDWRCSSFWTPDSPALPFNTIRKFKTVLGAIGYAAENLGIRVFADGTKAILDKLEAKGYRSELDDDGQLHVWGPMFRPTPYRHLLMLMLLALGNRGADAKVVGKNHVVAHVLPEPKDAVQAAIVKAIGKAAPATTTE